MLNIPTWAACTLECVVVETIEPKNKGRTMFFDIMNIMEANKFRRLPVVRDKELVGIITTRDLLKAIHGSLSCSLLDVLAVDSDRLMTPDPVTISPKTSIVEAAKIMKKMSIGCLPITSEGEKNLRGIITERDLLGYLPLIQDTEAKNCCSTNLITVDPATTLRQVIEIMANENIRHIVLVNSEGKIDGIITATDIIFSLKRVINKEMNPLTWMNLPVELLATQKTFVLPSDTPVTLISEIMKINNIGSFPIIEDKKLFGIITERDIVNIIAREGENNV